MPDPSGFVVAHRARVLVWGTSADAQREIQRIGPVPPAQDWLVDKAAFRPVRLEQVRGKAAVVLKQEMLALGGDCVVSPGVAGFDDTPAPVILLGTVRQYQRLTEKLQLQPFGLPDIGEELSMLLGRYEQAPGPLQLLSGELGFAQRTLVMGVINMTPDSFSGDGIGADVSAAVEQARRFAQAGADIIDIGGQSTRPGGEAVSVEEELHRVIPAVQGIRAEVGLPISIDTAQAEVARAALGEGAELINDVYGLRGAGMPELAAETGVPVVIMHMQGTPETMQNNPTYEDLITEIYDFLAQRVEVAVAAGVAVEQIVIDPGFGFGKTVNHNLEILRRLREFRGLGRPVLIGTSRKSTIGKVLDQPADQRLWGTAATCAVAITNGANIIRAHDVAEMAQVARMTDAILRGCD